MNNNQLPLVSTGIIFYNHESFAADTVKGALSQTYPNCEIILSDDCSTDNTFEVIRKAVDGYKGPHKIILNRNEKNIGLVPHINKVYNMSNGQFFCGNGGDDIPLPNRVSDSLNYFINDSELMALTMSYDIIDKNGLKIGENHIDKDEYLCVDDIEYLKNPFFIWGKAGRVIRREVWDIFGPMADDCQTEDSVLRFRSILLGKVLVSEKVGLKYRKHDTNISRDYSKLKTELIANQYRRDLEVVSDKMNKKLVSIIKAKINFYEKHRNCEFMIKKKGKTQRITTRLELLLYSILYRIKIFFLYQLYKKSKE